MPYFPLLPRLETFTTITNAITSERVNFAEMQAFVPGSLPIRLSVVLSNLRMQRMFDALIRPGDCVVDVGANIGYNTLYAAKCVGASGHVYAIEPAQDNLTILYANVFANKLHNVTILPYAAGSVRAIKRFFLRGEVSAVNSMYQENFYHPITETVEVLAVPLDALIQTPPALVKIDVEGGELEVLQGMARLLDTRPMPLIVEWHPSLQQAAGHPPDALPLHLLSLGFELHAVSHTNVTPLQRAAIPELSGSLLQQRSPVELLALPSA